MHVEHSRLVIFLHTLCLQSDDKATTDDQRSASRSSHEVKSFAALVCIGKKSPSKRVLLSDVTQATLLPSNLQGRAKFEVH